jgi:hypothetical protein
MRAEQIIKGARRMAVTRFFSLGMVRAAMTPGIAQANEERKGMKTRPSRPKGRSARSTIAPARGR